MRKEFQKMKVATGWRTYENVSNIKRDVDG
jgi:hypothetical protein